VVPLYGGNVASVMSGVLMYPRKCTWHLQWFACQDPRRPHPKPTAP